MATAAATTSARSKPRCRPPALAAGTRPGRMLATLLWLRTRAERKGDGPAVDMIDACLDGDPRAQLRMIVGSDVTLSLRQWDALECIWRETSERGVCPTYQEIADKMAISKPSVAQHVEYLIRKGALRKMVNWHGKRELRIVTAEERLSR